mmetsp:Transcript_4406/g.10456  ORF Transcript_4406/g.10456 Transcript_4406/m.10456 type:complete len:350 (+) Transcript_4406:565-1614(+)
MDVVEVLHCVSSRLCNNIARLGRSDPLDGDAFLVLQQSNQVLLESRVEDDTSAMSASTSSSARAMDVSIEVLGWFAHHHQVYVRHIQTSRSDIRCDEQLDFTTSEVFHGNLSSCLWDVAMKDPSSHGDQGRVLGQLVALLLGVCEDQGLPESTCVDLAEIGQGLATLVGRAGDALMGDVAVGLVLDALAHDVDDDVVLLEVLLDQVLHPLWHRRREEQLLRVFGDVGHDVLDILLEAHGEHLVGLVENHEGTLREVDARSLDVVKQPTRCCDDAVHPLSDFVTLRAERSTSIEAGRRQAMRYRNGGQLGVNLPRQLTGWCHSQHQRLSTLFARRRSIGDDLLNDRQAEG